MSDTKYLEIETGNSILALGLFWAVKKNAHHVTATYSKEGNYTQFTYFDKNGNAFDTGAQVGGNPQGLNDGQSASYPLNSGSPTSRAASVFEAAAASDIASFDVTIKGAIAIHLSDLTPMSLVTFMNKIILESSTQNTFENIVGLLDDNTVVKVAATAGDTDIEVGSGNDTVTGGNGADLVHKWKAGNLDFNGGGGIDTLDFLVALGVTFPTPIVQQLVANLDGAVGKNPYGGSLTLTNVENVIGTPAIDKITGNSSANVIGDGHLDYLAFDVIDGKGGNDTVYVDAQKLGNAKGGTGFDNLVVFQAATIDLQDTAFTSHVSGFEKFIAGLYGVTNSATMRGDANKNWFVGNFGVDILQGRGGDDTLDGGTDTAAEDVAVYSGNRANYAVKAVGATVTVTDTRGGKPDGIDTLYNLETLRFANGDVALQSILPKLGNVVFLGGPSSNGATSNNDSLYGTAASDTLWGQGGENLLEGGNGDDTYVNVGTGDIIVERAGGGNDTVTTYLLKYSLAKFAQVENLTGNSTGIAPTGYTLTGNAANNVIRGNFKKDTLSGADGNDTLQGGFDSDKLDGGAGSDTASYVDKNFAVSAALKGATASTVVVAGFDEKDTIRNIENLSGGSKNDTFTGDDLANKLWGNGGADKLSGGSGGDTLDGGSGKDTLTGGDGNDKFVYTSFEHGGDKITDFTVIAGDGKTFADRIDLSAIDAIAGGANDAFTFIGTAAFTAAGQVRVTASGASDTLVEINTSGTSGAEMAIILKGILPTALFDEDFVL